MLSIDSWTRGRLVATLSSCGSNREEPVVATLIGHADASAAKREPTRREPVGAKDSIHGLMLRESPHW